MYVKIFSLRKRFEKGNVFRGRRLSRIFFIFKIEFIFFKYKEINLLLNFKRKCFHIKKLMKNGLNIV
jgi:hypothetical protein